MNIEVRKKLEELLYLLYSTVIDILAHNKANFQNEEYKGLLKFLNYLIKYPKITCSSSYSIRLGLFYDYCSYSEEYCIRYDNEILWVGIEGIENSGMGSDSYDKEFININTASLNDNTENLKSVNLLTLKKWKKGINEMLDMNDSYITLEFYE